MIKDVIQYLIMFLLVLFASTSIFYFFFSTVNPNLPDYETTISTLYLFGVGAVSFDGF